MLKNYFKIAWRNMKDSKGFTFINVLGLSVGIACCILITLYVQDELSYDRYHKNVNQIYRVLHAYQIAGSSAKLPPPAPEEFQVWGNAPVGPALLAGFPEICKIAQFTSPITMLLEHKNKRFQEDNLLFADSTMFDLFSWNMLAGDPEKALVAPNSIVLTETMAQRYFGDDNPVGKPLRVDNGQTFNVTGVMQDVPSNSHFSFSALISMSTLKEWDSEIFDAWGYVDFYTYFLTPEGTDIGTLEAKLPDFVKRHYPDDNPATYTIALEPLTDAYLHSKAGRQPGVTGSMQQVYIFSVVAVFMLMIACINFMNLSTARSMERAKEVGVRKVVGAHRYGLASQFLTESVLISLAATGLAVVLAIVALPAIRDLSGKPFPYQELISWKTIPVLAVSALFIGILAGSYPAWVMTRFRPVLVLKGKFRSSSKGIMMRKGLVIVQFSLSIALIVGTAIVFLQLNHLRTHDLGFRQEQMLVIDYGGDEAINGKIETIKTILKKHPAVISASASRAVPGDFFPNAYTLIESPTGEMQAKTDPALYEIDADFIPLYKIKMAAGRAYSSDFSTDSTQALLLNEAAAKLYGYPDPEDILGKRFDQWGRKGTVIGVVSDFNYQSLHQKVEPLVLRMAPSYALNKLSLQVKSDDLSQTIAELEGIWNEVAPQRPFLYNFLDQSFNRQYQQDMRSGELFGIFAALTVFIACLGLFGLSTYATQQRIKEIGIRKVLGASVTGIVRLLSVDFVKLVIIAVLAAIPLSWWAMNRWLENFAYQIDIEWWVFALAGLLAVGIALLTVSFQSVKAALMNPVKSLRSE